MDKTRRTVLVVEDEQPLQVAIASKLKKNGFDVVTARTAEQAWGTIQDGVAIDAVWLDHYLLGGETGLDLLIKLKGDDKWSNIPVFVVSNTATQDKKQAYIEFGVSQYFVKSDNRLDEIIGAISGSLDREDT